MAKAGHNLYSARGALYITWVRCAALKPLSKSLGLFPGMLKPFSSGHMLQSMNLNLTDLTERDESKADLFRCYFVV